MTTSRRRATPLWIRLASLVAIPLVVVSVLGVQRVRSERAKAAHAASLVDIVELQATVTTALPPAQLEHTALSGLARVDSLGVPREFVVGLTGVDFEAVYSDNQAELDAAIDVLIDEHADQVLLDGSKLGHRLTIFTEELQVQRDRSDRKVADFDAIDDLFDSLDDVLLPLLTAVQNDASSNSALADQRVQVQTLTNVLVSAGDINVAVMSGLIESDVNAFDIIRAEAAHTVHIDNFVRTLNPELREEFNSVRALRVIQPDDTESPTTGQSLSELASNPTLIREAAVSVLEHVAYIDALAAFSTDFLQQTADEMRGAAADADSVATRTKILVIGVSALTLLFVALAAWSILAPIRRLARRADAISSGDLSLTELDERGPRDIRTLTRTVNDMTAVLDRVNTSIEGLATGNIDAANRPNVPGPLGVSIHHSVHRLASVTEQLHQSEALASAIIDQAGDSIWTVDSRGIIITANEASTALVGVPASQQLGTNIADILSKTSGEATVLSREDDNVRVLVARSAIDAGKERLTTLIAHDISERSQFEQRLAYQAKHDALTGLPNRFALLEHLEAIPHPDEVAVMFLDLDGFKSVNDVQGHAVGDQVLEAVAAKLAASVRDNEFVGRLGGDEFVIVTHRFAQIADVISLGHRLIREIELPYEHNGRFFSLSASIGVAVPHAGMSALDMIGQADNAVYQAKEQGRGRVVLFDQHMKQRIDSEAEVAAALRSAAANNELVLHLQPVFDLATNQIRGGEALIRWERPGYGLIPPRQFIPLAEHTDQILDIERWVLMQVCERLVAWRELEPECDRKVAVNISGRHLTEGDLVSDVQTVLTLTGADPRMLELELTERDLLHDVSRTTSALGELRALGVTIAVDDFGTGVSSMSHLRELPIDVVKIDQSFVARAIDDGYDSTVVEAILKFANKLNLTVIAEGIETETELAFLRNLGCDAAQGILLAKPLPVADAEALIFGGSRRELLPQ